MSSKVFLSTGNLDTWFRISERKVVCNCLLTLESDVEVHFFVLTDPFLFQINVYTH